MATTLNYDDIVDYLRTMKLDRYAKVFKDNEIDGVMMVRIVSKDDESLLEELEVKNKIHRAKIISNFQIFVEKRMS